MIEQLSKWGRTFSRYTSFPRYYLNRHLTEFAQTIGPTSLVLDIGSGRTMPYRVLFDAEQYVGIDFFEPANVTADAAKLPFGSESCSMVLTTEVLEHLSHPHKALCEMNRVLHMGGYLILTVPLIWGVHDYVDYQRWTERGLRLLLKKTGFEILKLRRRGAIFSMIGCMIVQIPTQLFGEMSEQKHWWSILLYMFFWILVWPFPWIASLFDGLDRRGHFTLGYSVLCRKNSVEIEAR